MGDARLGGGVVMRVIAIAAVLLFFAPGAVADWREQGHDAGQSASSATSGPEWTDVALRATSVAHDPIIVGDAAFFAAVDRFGQLEFSESIMRVDLRDGTVAQWANASSVIGGLASDGELLFASEGANLSARSLLDARPVWRVSSAALAPPSVAATFEPVSCLRLVLVKGALLAACEKVGQGGGIRGNVFVTAREAATGTELWSWELDRGQAKPVDPTGDPGTVPSAVVSPPERSIDGAIPANRHIAGFSVVGDFAFVSFVDVAFVGSPCSSWVVAIDLATHQDTLIESQLAIVREVAGPILPPEEVACFIHPAPIGVEGQTIVLSSGGIATTPSDEADQGRPAARYRISTPFGNAGAGLAYDGRRVFVPAGGTLYAFAPSLDAPEWGFVLPQGDLWGTDPRASAASADAIAVTPESVYAVTTRGELYCLDAKTGRLRWSDALGLRSLAVSEGLLVGTTISDIVILGHSAFSPLARAGPTETYPRPGQDVTLDLSGSTGSASGALSERMVEWGDGASDAWTGDATFQHRFDQAGDYLARGIVRNAANQTASVAILYHVGGSPPQNFLQQQFANENQNRTFFLLGIALTGGGALFGILRLRHRRGLLAREIAGLEEAVSAARPDAARVDRALDESRFRSRALLLDHRLDEGQHSVLVARIEDLARAERLDVVHAQLDFLPYKHVRALREILQDGRISNFERGHFLAQLDEDASISAEHKARARAIIEAWAQHDAGGTA